MASVRQLVRRADTRLRAALGSPRQSTETYLVAPVPHANVKIRDRLLDLKTLDRVDAHGLELWRPVLKSPFPIAPSTLASIVDAWSLPRPEHLRACASTRELVDHLREGCSCSDCRTGDEGARRSCLAGVSGGDCGAHIRRRSHANAGHPRRPTRQLWTVVGRLASRISPTRTTSGALQRFIAQRASITR